MTKKRDETKRKSKGAKGAKGPISWREFIMNRMQDREKAHRR